MKQTLYYYYCTRTVDDILGFPALASCSNVHIPLRIEQCLGRVFETFVMLWQAASLSTLSLFPSGGMCCCGPQNPIIIAAGMGYGEGNSEQGALGGFSLPRVSAQGALHPPPTLSPWLEGSKLLQLASMQAFQHAGNRFVFCYPFGFPPTWTATKIF